MRVFTVAAALSLSAVVFSPAFAEDAAAFDLESVIAAQFPEDTGPFMGDWEGKWSEEEEKDPFLGAQIIARGGDTYQINLVPELDNRGEPYVQTTVKAKDGMLTFKSGKYYGTVTAEEFTGGRVEEDPAKNATFKLKRVERPSPNLGKEPPEGAVVLFDGTNLDAWQNDPEGPWGIHEGLLMAVHPAGKTLVSKQTFTDVVAHIEFRLPYLPEKTGQERGNGGVFFLGEYEVQVLDSYGLPGYFQECGALYKVAPPKVNMCRPPGVWQSYDIEFTAAKFDEKGKQIANARITVNHNGKLIHNDEEIPLVPTNSYKDRIGAHPKGPGHFQLQAHRNHVQYRNIWIAEKK